MRKPIDWYSAHAARSRHRLPPPFLVQASQRERADGGPEPAAPEVRPNPDRLELADAVLVVGPAQAVGGKATVRRLDDAVERLTVRPLRANPRVARLGDPRGRPDFKVDRDALGHVGGADRPVAKAVRQRRRFGRLGQVSHQEVHRLTGLCEAVPASAERRSASSSNANATRAAGSARISSSRCRWSGWTSCSSGSRPSCFSYDQATTRPSSTQSRIFHSCSRPSCWRRPHATSPTCQGALGPSSRRCSRASCCIPTMISGASRRLVASRRNDLSGRRARARAKASAAPVRASRRPPAREAPTRAR